MKILVAADISPITIQTVEFLQKWLKPLQQKHTEVVVLHVYEPELDYSEDVPSKDAEIVPISEAKLKEMFQPLEACCQLNYVITNEGFGDSIMKRVPDMDLIVMGRRRRGQLQQVMLGSLSQYILERSPCPVLIVPESRSSQAGEKVLPISSVPQQPRPVLSPEALARLKTLICVAKADGSLDEQEKMQLEILLQEGSLPEEMTLDQLLTEPIDLFEEIAKITSPQEREITYYAAYTIANANAEYHPEEAKALQQILNAFNLPQEKVQQLNRLVNESYNIRGDGKIQPLEDPKQRAEAIDKKILRCSTATGVLGGFPSPVFSTYTQAAALGLQNTLVSEIAGLWGYPKFPVKPLFEKMVGSLSLVSAWLTALDLAKLVPKWGSRIGAADAFVATWAMGKTANSYFESGQELTPIALRQVFKQAKKEGEAVYRHNQVALAQQQQTHKAEIESLTEQLKAKKLTLKEYQKEIQQLLVMVKQLSY